jgi:hypothetical protein
VPTKQVSKVVPQRVPKQEQNRITDNSLIHLTRQTWMTILCKEIVETNDVTSKGLQFKLNQLK